MKIKIFYALGYWALLWVSFITGTRYPMEEMQEKYYGVGVLDGIYMAQGVSDGMSPNEAIAKYYKYKSHSEKLTQKNSHQRSERIPNTSKLGEISEVSMETIYETQSY